MPSTPPFSRDVFTRDHELQPSVASLLPASATIQHVLVRPTDDIHRYLLKDLAVERLNKIHAYLWLAGLPMPPKPLNFHVATRELILDERINMHMVWGSSNRLHLKPIPRYLIDADFWQSHIICSCSSCGIDQNKETKTCTRELYKYSMGFLRSYIGLIQFESDIAIAHSHHLLPKEITWSKWLTFVEQLLKNGISDPANFNSRYLFGELRLSRLNQICVFRYGQILRGYQFTYQTYGELFRAHVTPLTAAIVYIALVLTAMQVGLATKRLSTSLSFQNSSYGFTVFSILAPLIGLVLVGMFGVFQFSAALIKSWRFQQDQFKLFKTPMP
ncbi:hypothetical protein N7456_001456 [Penicillium angulare]|uniref:Subtilisin-like serine protease n=1 Tax=Penicillium angulare TaxID=116970 RepID=A0A9W9KPB1_9EURO|nr:hypothetical protein N7456_001456 [Penicillium angulare]